MGCLFKSFGVVLLLAILLPVMLIMSLVGTFRRAASQHRQESQPSDNDTYTSSEEEQPIDRTNKPIDQSTVEYIDFEEVDEK